ncbi:DUF3471 domain-containing protein [Chryseobacterium arthrosphaerae]|uniref:DUF3471 domain-containing protein n=1 Tax=Chryseobacterium arthrosphaerae TaxID=651561 RepID=A0A3S0QTU7_9FLAO|nr:DUF3471 domain-containing protein [Chryseobacterium arthrosphaerae]
MDLYCGEYFNKGYGTFTVTKEGNNLYILFPTFKFILVHRQYDLFPQTDRRSSAANES